MAKEKSVEFSVRTEIALLRLCVALYFIQCACVVEAVSARHHLHASAEHSSSSLSSSLSSASKASSSLSSSTSSSSQSPSSQLPRLDPSPESRYLTADALLKAAEAQSDIASIGVDDNSSASRFDPSFVAGFTRDYFKTLQDIKLHDGKVSPLGHGTNICFSCCFFCLIQLILRTHAAVFVLCFAFVWFGGGACGLAFADPGFLKRVQEIYAKGKAESFQELSPLPFHHPRTPKIGLAPVPLKPLPRAPPRPSEHGYDPLDSLWSDISSSAFTNNDSNAQKPQTTTTRTTTTTPTAGQANTTPQPKGASLEVRRSLERKAQMDRLSATASAEAQVNDDSVESAELAEAQLDAAEEEEEKEDEEESQKEQEQDAAQAEVAEKEDSEDTDSDNKRLEGEVEEARERLAAARKQQLVLNAPPRDAVDRMIDAVTNHVISNKQALNGYRGAAPQGIV